MRMLLISDAHGNYQATKQLFENVKFDEALFLGDAVDYGPEPAETVDMIFSNCNRIITGNHDYAAATGSDCGCAPAMHDLSVYTRENITLKDLGKSDLEKLRNLPDSLQFEVDGLKFFAVHGSPYNHLQGYVFATELEMIWKDKSLRDYDYILFGHTHFQTLYRGKLINPGSSGQPRDGIWMPSYAILNTENREVTFHRFKYDNSKTISLIRKRVTDERFLKQLEPLYL
ncbi:MAG: YfcE family phosphodiesterase [Thermoplasmataceae archaeon]